MPCLVGRINSAPFIKTESAAAVEIPDGSVLPLPGETSKYKIGNNVMLSLFSLCLNPFYFIVRIKPDFLD